MGVHMLVAGSINSGSNRSNANCHNQNSTNHYHNVQHGSHEPDCQEIRAAARRDAFNLKQGMKATAGFLDLQSTQNTGLYPKITFVLPTFGVM